MSYFVPNVLLKSGLRLSQIAHPLLCHCASLFKLFHLAHLMPPSLVSEGLALFNACRGSSLSYCTLHVVCPHVSPGNRYPTRGGFHLLEHDSYICPHCSQLVSNSMSLHSRKCTGGVVGHTTSDIKSANLSLTICPSTINLL